MRTTIATIAVAVIAAIALPTVAQASTSPEARTDAAQTTARASLVPWKESITVCLGKSKTRAAIKWLNRGKIGYALASFGLAEVPGFWSKLLNLGSTVNGFVAHRWARDTARAYISSKRRGAKVRVGIKGAAFVTYPAWDASKRDGRCK